MTDPKQYKIVSAVDPKELEVQVNALLEWKDDDYRYELHGTVFVSKTTMGTTLLSQAMTRECRPCFRGPM